MIEKYGKKLLKDIGEERYEHSCRVMEESVRLARNFDGDIEKARIAGLLHDCGKNVDEKDDLSHGPLGAMIAISKYSIRDEDILNAIRFHTTGRENMSLLEKIIFLADFIEPNRDFPGIEDVRIMAKLDLDKALLLAMNLTIKHIIENNMFLHLDTIRARNYLLKQIN